MPPHFAHGQTQASARYSTPLGSQGRQAAKGVDRREVDGLPSMDARAYYDPPSSPSSSSSAIDDSPPPSPHNLLSNSGNKLHPSARFIRKGKMYAWGPAYEDHKSDQRVRRRLKLCLEQLFPDAAAEVGAVPPLNIVELETKRAARKRKREEDAELVLPHLASPSPPISTRKLAPLLAIPQSYVDIMLSPAMRHSLGDDTVEVGLQRTAGELLESEKGLMQALGRLREVLRVRGRDVPEELFIKERPDANSDHSGQPGVNGHLEGEAKEPNAGSTTQNGTTETSTAETAKIQPLPHISDTDNLWRVTQELLQAQPQPTIAFTVTPPGAAAPSNTEGPQPTPTPIHRLFTCQSGITVNANPHPHHPNFAYPPTHYGYPQTVKYNLDLTNQCRAVDDALERIAELLADCNEYKERLEEARDRVADVARARKKVWSVVKERAGRELDKEGRV